MNLKLKTLFEWIRKNDGSIHPNVTYNNKFKLIMSEKLGAKGVNLFSIPDKLCISRGTYKNYKPAVGIFSQFTIEERECFNQPFFKLILNLISEKLKGRGSFYQPMISSFPKMEELVKNSPLFLYSDKRDKWVKVLPTLVTKLDNLNSFYISLYKLIVKCRIFKINIRLFPGYASIEDILRTLVLWAFLIVNNYAIENEYLLPLYNLMDYNHETQNAVTKDNNKINFSFGDIEKTELVINNGLLDNETLFALHGYINEDVKTKYLEIKLSNKITIDDKEIQAIITKTFEKFDRTQKYYITKDIPSPSLVQYLRIVSLTTKDLKNIDVNTDYYTKLVNMDNESNVYKKLLKIVKTKHKHIKNCIDKDDETDGKEIKILKKILKEQKNILQSMYYEIHKKWIDIMESDYDEDLLKNTFKLI